MASKTFGAFQMSNSILGYLSYAAGVTQAATGAPSATVSKNDFGTTTFTWARSGAGTYTVTANSAVFTSGKTQVIIPTSTGALTTITYVITSTSVITFTTNVTTFLTAALVITATDSLFNTFVTIQVFD